MLDNDFYESCLKELKTLIPKEEIKSVMSQPECELEPDFLGFVNVYQPLNKLIPENCIVIDFGCYLAPQAYFFQNHRGYIGVDMVDMKRFTPANARHYVCSIQDFIKNQVPKLFQEHDNLSYFAICSYVPDQKATELVRKTFQNVCCYYPGGD